jgi:hypothetical protein
MNIDCVLVLVLCGSVLWVCGGTSSGADVVCCVVLLWCLYGVGAWFGVWCGGRWRPIKPQTH